MTRGGTRFSRVREIDDCTDVDELGGINSTMPFAWDMADNKWLD